VNRGQRSVVPGIHGLQHVKSFLATHFPDDDPVGAHPQAVDYELSRLNPSLAVRIGGTTFQPDNVSLLQLQFCRVFDDSFPASQI
jgi:hypothetical protein